MDENKKKEGVSVKEIEAFTKKHRLEVFFCIAFVLACFFTFVMFGPGWSIVAATVGAVLGVIIPEKVTHLSQTIFHFVFKQEQTTQIILAVVGFILAVFLPPVIFLLLGLHGGKDMYHWASEIYSQHRS